MASMADNWRQEGLEKGLKKGLERGLEKGLEEGKAQKIKELLTRYLNERPNLKARYQQIVDQTSGEKALDDLFFSIIGKGQGAT